MPNIKDLAKKVRERQRLIEKIVKFVIDLVVHHGERTHYSQGSCHTHIVWELKNLSNFSFKADLGHTMMGGNDI